MINPEQSDSMWAASVIIATEFERYPPTTSAIINKKHITVIIVNFRKAIIEFFRFSLNFGSCSRIQS